VVGFGGEGDAWEKWMAMQCVQRVSGEGDGLGDAGCSMLVTFLRLAGGSTAVQQGGRCGACFWPVTEKRTSKLRERRTRQGAVPNLVGH
jgi:hypothetical protein